MNNLTNGLIKLIWTITLCLSIFGCSEDLQDLDNKDAQLTSTEVKTVLEANELSNLTDGLLTDIFSGNQSGKMAKMPDCHQTETLDATTTITFTNCIVDGSEPINGTITANYSIGEESTTISVTYTTFSVGAIAISGTKTFTFATGGEQQGFVFTVESDMQVVLGDGKVVSEKGTKIIGFVFDSLEQQTITLDGVWTVTSDGNTYTAFIDKQLNKVLPCEFTGEGLLRLSKNGLSVSVDFGDGTCDDLASVIYPDGTAEQITLED